MKAILFFYFIFLLFFLIFAFSFYFAYFLWLLLGLIGVDSIRFRSRYVRALTVDGLRKKTRKFQKQGEKRDLKGLGYGLVICLR